MWYAEYNVGMGTFLNQVMKSVFHNNRKLIDKLISYKLLNKSSEGDGSKEILSVIPENWTKQYWNGEITSFALTKSYYAGKGNSYLSLRP